MGSCLSRGAVEENKVVPNASNEKGSLGPRGYSKIIEGKDGASLFAYFWPTDPGIPLKGIIQLAHGSAAYTCFDYLKSQGPGQPHLYAGSWVESFNRAGFAVCGADQQGTGRSKGPRCPAGTPFQGHVDNLLLLADYALAKGGAAFPRAVPYFLVGHCVGGLAAALACAEQPGRFRGLVLLSPLLSDDESLTGRKSGSSSQVTPKGDKDSASPEATAPSFISKAWAADPYIQAQQGTAGERLRQWNDTRHATELLLCGPGGRGSGSAAAGAAAGAGAAQADDAAADGAGGAGGGMAGALALPLLIFHSERDTFAQPAGATRLYESAVSSDKTLRWLDQQWHVLTKEEGWEGVLRETTAWLVARATKSGALVQGLSGPAAAASPGGGTDATIAVKPAGGKGTEEEEEEQTGKTLGEKGAKGLTPEGALQREASATTTSAEAAAAAAAAPPPRTPQQQQQQQPLLTRSMSMLERMPEHEPLVSRQQQQQQQQQQQPEGGAAAGASSSGTGGGAGGGGDRASVLLRRYSFSGGHMPLRAEVGGGGGGAPGTLPPLGQRGLGALPPEVAAAYSLRGKLKPLPPLLPLMDRTPVK